jgi:hypothetical protein
MRESCIPRHERTAYRISLPHLFPPTTSQLSHGSQKKEIPHHSLIPHSLTSSMYTLFFERVVLSTNGLHNEMRRAEKMACHAV